MSSIETLSETNLKDFPLLHRGKVRDVLEYDADKLLLVATDRISAFDCVIPTAIPNKGKILTQLSAFWFEKLKGVAPNHLITADFEKMPEDVQKFSELRDRTALVKKTKVFPVECVVRGYLAGSGWKDYKKTGEICGHKLPENLAEAEKLPEPIFTPATKAATGHDENISEANFARVVGENVAEQLKTVSLALYREASEYAITKGIIIADTKFEFGQDAHGSILLIDEILTPDSSRFWEADKYQTNQSPASFDKQFVRDYLETLDWAKQPPAPLLPTEIVEATQKRYLQAFELLTGKGLD